MPTPKDLKLPEVLYAARYPAYVPGGPRYERLNLSQDSDDLAPSRGDGKRLVAVYAFTHFVELETITTAVIKSQEGP